MSQDMLVECAVLPRRRWERENSNIWSLIIIIARVAKKAVAAPAAPKKVAKKAVSKKVKKTAAKKGGKRVAKKAAKKTAKKAAAPKKWEIDH